MFGVGCNNLPKTSNLSNMLEPGSLPKVYCMIPRVVRDAIDLTLHIKERLLWVDSLCIIQDDVGESINSSSSWPRSTIEPQPRLLHLLAKMLTLGCSKALLPRM